MKRIVVVLGREPELDMDEVVRRAWKSEARLVVLNLGAPLTRPQEAAIDVALEAAGKGLIEFDALILHEASDARAKILPDDSVIFALTPRERRTVERALRA